MYGCRELHIKSSTNSCDGRSFSVAIFPVNERDSDTKLYGTGHSIENI